MKDQIFTLSTVHDVNRLMTAMKTTWRKLADDKTPYVVKLSIKQEDVSSAQRRLYWMWCTQFADHFGDHKDSVHKDMKKRFLIAIYMRDDPDFNAMCESIAQLKKSECEQYESIRNGVIKMTSLTNADKAQLSELLDLIYGFSVRQGLRLKCPDDLKYLRD